MYAIVIVLEILYVKCLYKEINVFLLFFFFFIVFFFMWSLQPLWKKIYFQKKIFHLLLLYIEEDIYFYEGLDHNFVCVFCSETFCWNFHEN